ncbi:MAG: hypothetical protein FWD68_07490 [Alphaproteobacteria bacterium]|nr:hypothetical protein [Alphaproteobacteria bacterium]
MPTDETQDEITPLRKLLNLLDIKGAIVSVNAMGCQKKIVETIVDFLAQTEPGHRSGFFIQADGPRAALWYRRAAEQGHTTAAAYPARMYEKGQRFQMALPSAPDPPVVRFFREGGQTRWSSSKPTNPGKPYRW